MSTAAPVRVLIVEDETDLAGIFQQYLAARGHDVDVATSAEAAVDRLRASPPHVIVLDVKLPGMSGLEFMSLPVVREAGIPIVVVSGHASEEDARECLRLGALEFLPKPVPLEVLGKVLDHACLFAGAAAEDGGSPERRRASRVAVALPLRMVTERGQTLRGVVAEVSATGLRTRLDGSLRQGSAVRLTVDVPDGGPAVDALALVVRTDPNGDVALWFLDVLPVDTERLLARGRPPKAR